MEHMESASRSRTVRREELIRALRCISTAGGSAGCERCPYLVAEIVEGEPYESCDMDRIGLDAADLLEQLTQDRPHSGSGRSGEDPGRGGEVITI